MSVLAGLLFVPVSGVGCGSGDAVDAGGSGTGSYEGPCGEEDTLCDSRCVFTEDDPSNCGGCNRVCREGQECEWGECRCSAELQEVGPDGACVSVRSDPENCGALGHKCPAKSECIDGICYCTERHTRICGDQCVHYLEDAAHCGPCDNACSESEVCYGGQCVSGSALGAGGSAGHEEIGGGCETSPVSDPCDTDPCGDHGTCDPDGNDGQGACKCTGSGYAA
ncbi:MAG: hypothetical protein JW940_18800 [Polyangiaceae bacterium]|nr:hypothetical protein [Polyangiaceae bacterium]